MRLLIILSFISLGYSLSAQLSFTINSSGCTGQSFPVVANTGTSVATGYTWSAMPTGVVFSSTNASSTIITFSAVGNYTISLAVTYTNGSDSISNSINMAATPSIIVTQSSFTTCVTNNFPLYSKPVVISLSGAGSYTWQPPLPPPMSGTTNGSPGTVRPSISSCYTITGISIPVRA